jgi:hypothetical protein
LMPACLKFPRATNRLKPKKARSSKKAKQEVC